MSNPKLEELIKYILSNNKEISKYDLSLACKIMFNLTQDRSIFYCPDFAIRFCQSNSKNFSNTIVSLSSLQKYDKIPLVVCLVSPDSNYLYLINSTFIKKISHSSKSLRVDNIRGSINGSDIFKSFAKLNNSPENFEDLFNIHKNVSFDDNLIRLVESTNNITPTGKKFIVEDNLRLNITEAPNRAIKFVKSNQYLQLKNELDTKVSKYKNEILIAGFIENVNIRGRIIEYLIAGEDEKLKQILVDELQKNSNYANCPKMKHDFGDYSRLFEEYQTETDIKTKIMIQNSNPKAYNLDKLLEFLAKEKSVFMFYFIGLEPNKIVSQVLVNIFQEDLLDSTILLHHWAGRNSRGVSQFNGKIVHNLILKPNNKIDIQKSQIFLNNIIEL